MERDNQYTKNAVSVRYFGKKFPEIYENYFDFEFSSLLFQYISSSNSDYEKNSTKVKALIIYPQKEGLQTPKLTKLPQYTYCQQHLGQCVTKSI
jgi:hypothetical protein